MWYRETKGWTRKQSRLRGGWYYSCNSCKKTFSDVDGAFWHYKKVHDASDHVALYNHRVYAQKFYPPFDRACVFCFYWGDIMHHITYFPEYKVRACETCHAVIHFSKDPMFDIVKQYQEGDRMKLSDVGKEIKYDRHVVQDARHVDLVGRYHNFR